MEQLEIAFENMKAVKLVDVLIAFCIMILFLTLSSTFSYILIKLVKIKGSKSQVKNSAFYNPLKIFISISGVYLAILYLKDSLGISDSIMDTVTKIYQIVSTIAFSKALAESFTLKSTLIKKYRKVTDKDINEQMLKFSLRIIRVIIYFVEILVILSILDIKISGLLTSFGIGGIILTLAAQDTAKNIIGGLAIFLDRTFNVGDWIETPNYDGIVEGMTFRTTRIRNFDNAIVNIPNSVLANTSIINWSKIEKRRYKIKLPFSFETTSAELNYLVERIKEMLKKNPDTINEDILISFDTISTTNIILLIDIFVKTTSYEEYERTRDRLNSRILDIIHESNVKLAYPASTVFVDNESNRS